MVKLPDETAFGQRPDLGGQYPLVSATPAASGYQRGVDVLARDAAQAGQGSIAAGKALIAGAKEVQSLVEHKDNLALTKAKAQFLDADLTTRDKLIESPDYKTYMDTYSRGLKAARDKILEDLPGRLHRNFDAAVAPDLARGRHAVRGMARKELAQQTVGFLDALHDRTIQQVTAPGATKQMRDTFLRMFSESVTAAQGSNIISDADAISRRKKLATDYGHAVIGEWFKRQPDPVIAVEQLNRGTIADREAKEVWTLMSADDREAAVSSQVTIFSRLATMKNRQRSDAEDREKQQQTITLHRILFDDKMTEDQRRDALEVLKQSPFISTADLTHAEEMLREGSRGSAYDVAADVLTAEQQIRAGRITTQDALAQHILANRWKISIDTHRTRLMPMIEDRLNASFREALNWGQAELGISSGVGLLGAAFADPIDKASKFEAMLRRYKIDNPNGDFIAYAQKIVPTIKAQLNKGAATALPTMVQQYRNAKTPQAKAAARDTLITVMQESGIVDGLTASDPSFDPLAHLEEARAKRRQDTGNAR